MKWNKEQLEAINYVGENILVSASAGSGKTAVLVQRLIKRCLIDKIRLDKIIALTFTEAASNEMKKRLAKRLNEELEKKEIDESLIVEQLVYLQSAQISTIHSFCLNCIRKYGSEIHLNPKITANLLSDGVSNQLKREAFETIIEKYCEQRKEEIGKIALYFSSTIGDFSGLEEAINKIITKANSCLDRKQWFEDSKRLAKKVPSINDFDEQFQQSLMNHYRDIFLLSLKNHEEAITLCDDEKTIELLKKRLEFLKAIEKSCSMDEQRHLLHGLVTIVVTKHKKHNDEFNELIVSINECLKELVSEMPTMDLLVKSHNDISDLSILLLDMAYDTMVLFDELKRENEGMNFDDMERFAYDILKANDYRIAKLYRDDIEEILIDEFQDTSELQNEILVMISRGNNMFRVGDVKQSIYRFRKAKPEIMRQYRLSSDNHNITLGYNYRSNQGIINFNNELFQQCMNVIEDGFDESDVAKVGTSNQCLSNNKVEALVITKEMAEEEENNNLFLAETIVKKILTMKEETPYKQWKDYVILMRSHGNKKYFKEVFEKYNIPYYADSKQGFYKSEAAILVMSMLRAIHQLNEVDVVSVLSSSMYKISDNDLALLKINYGSIMKGLKETNHIVLRDIKDYRDILQQEGICSVLSEIAKRHDFYDVGLNHQQKANFDYLYELAQQFEKRDFGLINFIKEVDLVVDDDSIEAVSIGNDDDVVQVMTVHHSKGLQFNVVFYWANSRVDYRDSSGAFVIDSDVGIGLKGLDFTTMQVTPTFNQLAISSRIHLEESQENTRLLYVALTRAKEHLIICSMGTPVERAPLTYEDVMGSKGSIHTICKAMMHHDLFQLSKIEHREVETKKVVKEFKAMKRYEKEVDNKSQFITPSKSDDYLQLNFNKQLKVKRGLLMHEIIEQLDNKQWTRDDLLPFKLNETDIQQLLWFSQSNLYQQCLLKTIKKEFHFVVDYNDQLIQGAMDFIAYDEKEVVLIDFKSDRDVSETELIERYKKQLLLYKQCLSVLFPDKKCTGYIVSLTLMKAIEIS